MRKKKFPGWQSVLKGGKTYYYKGTRRIRFFAKPRFNIGYKKQYK